MPIREYECPDCKLRDEQIELSTVVEEYRTRPVCPKCDRVMDRVPSTHSVFELDGKLN